VECERRIVAFDRVTADGYFAASDGNLSWVVQDAEVDRLGGDAVPSSDNVVLFGRRTYDMFEGFWPRALDDDSPAAPNPHQPDLPRTRPLAARRCVGIREARPARSQAIPFGECHASLRASPLNTRVLLSLSGCWVCQQPPNLTLEEAVPLAVITCRIHGLAPPIDTKRTIAGSRSVRSQLRDDSPA
jgi:hypothetical protein